MYGCEKASTYSKEWWKIDKYTLDRCPLKIVDKTAFDYIAAYKVYKDGFLPEQGGWVDQPAKLMEIFSIIDSQAGKIQEENRKEKR